MPVNKDDIIDWLNDKIADGEIAKHALALLKQVQEPLAAGKLSPHFTLQEMIYSATAAQNGIDNTPEDEETEQLRALCRHTLERVRTLCGNNPVQVTSGYRSPQVNQMVGGASNSAHMYGCAADIIIPAFGSPWDICKMVQPHLSSFGIDQLIYENKSWVHIGRAIPPSTTPRCQTLTINGGSTVNGLVGP